MSEVEFISAWQQSSDRVREDAIALWAELNILPEEVSADTRADQLLYGGYIDGELACIATANVLPYNQVHHKFALTRYLTNPDFRKHDLMDKGMLHGHLWLQEWSKEHPEATLSGTMWTWSSKDTIYARKAAPYYPRRPDEKDIYPRAILVGWTEDDIGIWIWWFDHITV